MVWPVSINRITRGALLVILILALPLNSLALDKGIRLPFRMSNNLIILDVQINGSDTLHFILDTGLKNSIICELGSSETVDLGETREILIGGLGEGNPAQALQSAGNSLDIGGKVFRDCDFVILSNTVLQLSFKMGTRIHGMLSMQVFSDYVVEIDYVQKFLTLTPPEFFRYPDNGKFSRHTVMMESGKPFIQAAITTTDGVSFPVLLLLDSGASNALWLDINSLKGISIPENAIRCFLGCGISGDVQGYLSRIKQVDIGPFKLTDVIVSYPDSIAIARQERVPGRNGSMGSEILKRFDVIMDIPGRVIYLRPNLNFTQYFRHDLSGIEVLAEVPDEPLYIISRVNEGSVAYLAGIRAGDRILSINNTSVNSYSLDDIYRNLLGSGGRKVRMVILRAEKKLKFIFPVQEYI